MTRNLKNVLTILIAFAIYFYLQSVHFKSIYAWLFGNISSKIGAYVITYIVVGIPLLACLFLIRKASANRSCSSIGIRSLQGFVPGFVFALPMLLGFALVFEFNAALTWNRILTGAVFAAFFEELYFRGFLFGMLFRHSRFGFIPAVLPGALLFGAGHLWQSGDPGTAALIFLTTFAGAVWFAWTYAEWNYNLWVPVSLHLFMNLYWMLFSAGDNAMGGTWANIFRALTIALTIAGTLWYKRRKGLPMAINGSNLWMKKGSES